jgi:NTE family protein
MPTQFRNLIFEGGGVRGIAYVGAMQVLEQRNILNDIKRVGGTSAGAINALLFSLGYTIAEQRDILRSTDFKNFMDDSFGVIRDIRRLATEFGWNKGEFFSCWIGELIKKKLGKETATFKDLENARRPALYVTGTKLSTGYSEIYSGERHSDMPLASAVRISMSIPLFFAAVRNAADGDVYVDGGCMVNYPVKIFDRERYIDMQAEASAALRTDYYNKQNALFLLNNPGRSPYAYNCQTLGMRLDTTEEIAIYRYNEEPKSKPIKNFTGYAKALIGAMLHVQENQHLHGDDWQRTVYINTLDVGTTDFDLTSEKKESLIREGISGAENYFRWFENPQEQPVNRMG